MLVATHVLQHWPVGVNRDLHSALTANRNNLVVGIKYSEFKFQNERVGRPMRVYIEPDARFHVAVKPSTLQFFDCITSACNSDALLIAETATPRNLDPRGNVATGQGLPKFGNGNGPSMSRLREQAQRKVETVRERAQGALDAAPAAVEQRYRQYQFDRAHPGVRDEDQRTREILERRAPPPRPALVRRNAQRRSNPEKSQEVQEQNAEVGSTKRPLVQVMQHDLEIIGRDNAQRSHAHQHIFKGKPRTEAEKSFGAFSGHKEVSAQHCNKDINQCGWAILQAIGEDGLIKTGVGTTGELDGQPVLWPGRAFFVGEGVVGLAMARQLGRDYLIVTRCAFQQGVRSAARCGCVRAALRVGDLH